MSNDFIKAIEAEGLTPPHQIIADGELYRFDSDNSGKSNGSYVFYADEPQSGWFRCWKTGSEKKWSRGYSETDPVKKEQFQKLMEQRSQERKKKLQELISSNLKLGLLFKNSFLLKDFYETRKPENIIIGLGINMTNIFFKDNRYFFHIKKMILNNVNNFGFIKKISQSIADRGIFT